ncbi:MAG TPA: hypothetical protein VG148_00485 [Pyrinomonadaceae bacterium]|nr:hypothetical protein [Pyrinomonadaceae bacterium]
MKRAVTVPTILALLLSLVLWSLVPGAGAQQLTTQLPGAQQTGPATAEPKEDADGGRRGRSGLSFKEYLARREQAVAKLRGLPFGVPGNPRVKALRQLEQQELALFSSASTPSTSGSTPATSAGTTSAAAAGDVPQWRPLGPAPIPDGQTNFNEGSVDITRPRNPVSGRVLAVAVHPANPNIAYAGTAQGGLYRTLNGGATWTAIMDEALSLAVGAVALDPTDPTTLFVGTGEGNFCGDCFFGVGFYVIKFAETDPVLLGPYNSATNTPNGMLANSRSITKILANPNDHNQIFVATGSGTGGISGGVGLGPNPTPRGLFRCENVLSGTPSCTKLNLNGPNGGLDTAVRDLAFEPGNPNVLLAGVDDPNSNGVWRTTNALAADPSAVTFTRTLVSAASTNVQLAAQKTGSVVTVYAALEEGRGTVKKSTDGGATWSAPLASANGFCGDQCFYDMPIAVDPTDANRVYIGGSGDYDAAQTEFKKSTNGGATFVKRNVGLHPDAHAIAVAPSDPSVIYHGNDGGIFKSTNFGDTWASVNTEGFYATQFMSLAQHPVDRNFMIGGTQDNGTPFFQPDGTWKLGDYGDGGYALIDRNSADTGESVTAYHTYYNVKAALIGFVRADSSSAITPDGGWSSFYGCGVGLVTPNGISCTDDTLFYAPMAQGPGDPNTVYFGTDKLYRSADRGQTMPPVSQVFETIVPPPGTVPARVNAPVSAIGISPQDDNVRLVGITTGRVFATTLGAPVLTEVTPPVTPRKFIGRAVIDPLNKKTAYVTLVGYGVPDGQHVWKTTNLDTSPLAPAVTWTPAGAGIPDVPVNAFAVDPRDTRHLYAGTDIGVYRSTDGGASWQPFGAGLPRVAVFDMAILPAFNVLRVATHGRGIWEIEIPGFGVTAPPVFAGLATVTDPKDGSRLVLNWAPAASANPAANIVYDVYRVSHVEHGTMQSDPTFTPDASNKVATVTGTSYTDRGLDLAQVYYYIVQARDTTSNQVDTGNAGNRFVRFSAPTVGQLAGGPFPLETFETEAASARFTPPLAESGDNPNQNAAAFQRITVGGLGGPSAGKMYAPDFSPGDEQGLPDEAGTHHGGQSDFYTQLGPFNGPGNPALTETSILEFDHSVNAEARFDGGNIEVKVGAPFAPGDATPFPDNATTFDLGDYIIEGGYNGKLDGALPGGGFGSPLQGRRAYTGVKAPHHVRAVLRNFAPGGLHNPQGLPVYVRFRMTSDVASANGLDSGWFVDNLAINDLACRLNLASSAAGATALASSVYPNWDFNPMSAIDGDRTGKNWGAGGGWNDGTRGIYPDWLEVSFASASTIDEVRVYTLQDGYTSGAEPTAQTTASENGIIDFDIQAWDGSAWVTVPGGAVRGNSLALRSVQFPAVTTAKLRVLVLNSRLNYSRVVEVEAFGCGQ